MQTVARFIQIFVKVKGHFQNLCLLFKIYTLIALNELIIQLID